MACYNTGDFSCTYDSNAGAGKNYTSLATWESDSDNDLSGTGITKLLCYDSQNHNNVIGAGGATGTDATHYRRIESAPDCAIPFAGKSGTGANFVYSGVQSNMMSIIEPYFQFRQICAKYVGTSSGTAYTFRIGVDSPGSKIINCVAFDGINSVSGVVRGMYITSTAVLFNCIVLHNQSYGIFLYNSTATYTIAIICCTVVGNGGIGIYNGSFAWTSIAFGNYSGNNAGGDYNEDGWDAPSNYNVAGDETADLGGQSANYINNKDYFFGGADAIMDADCLLTAPNADGRNPYDDVTSVTGDFDDFLRNDTPGDTLFSKSIDNRTRYNESIADAPWSVGASQYDVYASKSLAESGAGVDAIGSLAAALSLADSGAGADAISALAAALSIVESGAGIDAILQTDITEIRQMTMTFSKREMAFEFSQRGMTFELNKED